MTSLSPAIRNDSRFRRLGPFIAGLLDVRETATSRSSGYRAGRRVRLASSAISLLIILLLLLAISLVLRPSPQSRPAASSVVGFDVVPDAPKAATKAKKQAKANKQKPHPQTVKAPPLPKPVVKVKEAPKIDAPVDDGGVIWLTKDQYRATNVRTMKRAPSDTISDDDGNSGDSGGGSAAGDSQLSGQRGPNGEPVYNAEWVREPTNAELNTYLPAGFRGEGWGLIMCRTIAGHRVDDCREIGDSPPGSRLAGAVRQAAWQFRVRAPRKGGKEMVGAWVSILIKYHRGVR